MLDNEAVRLGFFSQRNRTGRNSAHCPFRPRSVEALGRYESCKEYEFRRLPRFSYHRRNGKTRDRIRSTGSKFAVAAQANCQCALHLYVKGDSVRVPLRHDDSVLYSKLDEIGICFKTKILHDAVFVKGHCPRCDLQNTCHFFHRFAFRQQLDDFSLTRRQ